jgi:hypothetical protein
MDRKHSRLRIPSSTPKTVSTFVLKERDSARHVDDRFADVLSIEDLVDGGW